MMPDIARMSLRAITPCVLMVVLGTGCESPSARPPDVVDSDTGAEGDAATDAASDVDAEQEVDAPDWLPDPNAYTPPAVLPAPWCAPGPRRFAPESRPSEGAPAEPRQMRELWRLDGRQICPERAGFGPSDSHPQLLGMLQWRDERSGELIERLVVAHKKFTPTQLLDEVDAIALIDAHTGAPIDCEATPLRPTNLMPIAPFAVIAQDRYFLSLYGGLEEGVIVEGPGLRTVYSRYLPDPLVTPNASWPVSPTRLTEDGWIIETEPERLFAIHPDTGEIGWMLTPQQLGLNSAFRFVESRLHDRDTIYLYATISTTSIPDLKNPYTHVFEVKKCSPVRHLGKTRKKELHKFQWNNQSIVEVLDDDMYAKSLEIRNADFSGVNFSTENTGIYHLNANNHIVVSGRGGTRPNRLKISVINENFTLNSFQVHEPDTNERIYSIKSIPIQYENYFVAAVSIKSDATTPRTETYKLRTYNVTSENINNNLDLNPEHSIRESGEFGSTITSDGIWIVAWADDLIAVQLPFPPTALSSDHAVSSWHRGYVVPEPIP